MQTLDNSISVLYSNRGMAYKKLEEFDQVKLDGAAAVRLDKRNAKGHYLLGLARCRLAGEDISLLQEGVQSLKEARKLVEAQRKPKTLVHDYSRALAVHNKRLWTLRLEADRLREVQFVSLLESLLPRAATGAATTPTAHDALAAELVARGEAAAAGPGGSEDLIRGMLEHFASREAARAAEEQQEVPPHFLCSITMEPMLDPVFSPASGCSFERSAIEQWLATSKAEDPVSRAPLTAAQLKPNLALKACIDAFLEEHPWAHPTPAE